MQNNYEVIGYKTLKERMEKIFSSKQIEEINRYCHDEGRKGNYFFLIDNNGYNMIVNTAILEILCWLENDALDFGSAFYIGKNLGRFLENLKEDIF